MSKYKLERKCTQKIFLALIISILINSMTAICGIEFLPESESSVAPEIGVLYNLSDSDSKSYVTKAFDDIKDYRYNYNLNLIEEGTSPSQISLEIFVGNKSWKNIPINPDMITNNIIKVPVDISEYFDLPFLGMSKYRFFLSNSSPKKVIHGGAGSGPYIEVNFKNEAAIKKGKDRYDYSVMVCASKDIMSAPLPIYIYYKNTESGEEYHKYEVVKYYFSREEEWETITWVDAPPFSKLEFLADQSRFKVPHQ